MDPEEIKSAVRTFILREFLPGEDPAELTDSLPLISGRILDSLATLKLVAFLEDTYGFEFAAHEVGAANLDTIDIIARFVTSKRDGAS
jgi:acyl carrier protein